MAAETSDNIATLAGRILGAGNPLDDEGGHFMSCLVEALDHPETADRVNAISALLQPHFDNMLSLAASALNQHEENESGLGFQVSLVDVFSAWGEREAQDTAMLMDLCLGAAIEQLGGTAVRIESSRLEELAASGRIVRLQPEPHAWSVGLMPTLDSPIDYARAVEWSRTFTEGDILLDFFGAILPVGGRAPTYRDVAAKGYSALFEWVSEAFTNPPGENAPEKRIADQALSADVSEPLGDSRLDSQDGLDKEG